LSIIEIYFSLETKLLMFFSFSFKQAIFFISSFNLYTNNSFSPVVKITYFLSEQYLFIILLIIFLLFLINIEFHMLFILIKLP
jgi:hypothetical protein